MPTPTGGLLEITLNSSFLGAQCANVFHYWNASNNEPVSFVALAADFMLKVLDQLAPLQSTLVTYDNVRVKTILGTLPDLVAVPSQADGDVAGDTLNSFTSFRYRYSGVTKETRPGGKRFPGLVETNVSGNGLFGTYLTSLTTFETQLELSLDSGTDLYDPVIASRPTPTRATWVVNVVDSVNVFNTVTSQVSRKV